MAIGLQVMDGSGKIVLDMNRKITKVIGTKSLSGKGEITNAEAGYPKNQLWMRIIGYPRSTEDGKRPIVRCSGDKILWQDLDAPIDILYGVY